MINHRGMSRWTNRKDYLMEYLIILVIMLYIISIVVLAIVTKNKENSNKKK